VLGENRTDILVTALREYLQEAPHDDTLVQEIAAAYYDDEITSKQVETLLGAAEAANLQVLKQQLDDDFIDEIVETYMSILVPDTSGLVSLGIVAGEPPDPLSMCLTRYDVVVPAVVIDELRDIAAHGRAAGLVCDRSDSVTTRSVALDGEFPLDDGENAAVTLANEIDAAILLCDEFTQIDILHASLADTRLITTPTPLSVLVRTDTLPPEEARTLLAEISEKRSWNANSYVQRARSLLAER